MIIEATTSLPAVDRLNADRWNADRLCGMICGGDLLQVLKNSKTKMT